MSTYVMSDVHGLKGRYDMMMEALQLGDDDVLYVLGDVIDRGPDGIAILLDIMQRDNVVMLLGNHEYMMKQYYEALHHIITDAYEANTVITRWHRNHCEPTVHNFEQLSLEQQRQILSFLDGLPLAICDLQVHGERFYLTHGCAHTQFQTGIVRQEDVAHSSLTVESFVWDRMDVYQPLFDDRCVIVGHTPTPFFQDDCPYAIWTDTKDIATAHCMDIDCGCAANDRNTRLAVVCLDTRTVQYF